MANKFVVDKSFKNLFSSVVTGWSHLEPVIFACAAQNLNRALLTVINDLI